jgi:hypothetical protein
MLDFFHLLTRARKAQHVYALAAPQLLQRDFLAVGKAHCIPMRECLNALLNKDHFFYLSDAQASL